MSERNHKNRKRSFKEKIKRAVRNGNYGKGRSLSEDQYNYYITIFQEMKNLEGYEKCKSLLL